jgi:hypothetical protein
VVRSGASHHERQQLYLTSTLEVKDWPRPYKLSSNWWMTQKTNQFICFRENCDFWTNQSSGSLVGGHVHGKGIIALVVRTSVPEHYRMILSTPVSELWLPSASSPLKPTCQAEQISLTARQAPCSGQHWNNTDKSLLLGGSLLPDNA